MMQLIKTIGMALCLLTLEVQAFDAIKVDQAVKKLFQGFFVDDEKSTDCKFSYSYESIRYARESDRYPDDLFDEYPELKKKYLPDDIEVKIDKADFCFWSDGYWITLRDINGEYKIVSYTSFSQPE